jgi:hypothetical protein
VSTRRFAPSTARALSIVASSVAVDYLGLGCALATATWCAAASKKKKKNKKKQKKTHWRSAATSPPLTRST